MKIERGAHRLQRLLSSMCVRVCVCTCADELCWVEAAEFLGPPAPSSPSLSEKNTEEPLLLLIYYVNDYIPHWLAIVSLMDLIKLGLITAGDI